MAADATSHKHATHHRTTTKRKTASVPTVNTPSAAAPHTVSTSSAAARGTALAGPVTSLPQGGTEDIIVTGSALSTSNNTSANPVQIITARQIQQSGVNTLSDFFQRLPSIGSSGTYNTQTNGTNGAACTDLRNLGSNRVLVLIDGKRTAKNGNSNCVDLNTIPIAAVQTVEILKDGGSELYGADAVSGVINIKLRHDVDTGNITLRGGVTGHGDNLLGQISAYKGWNFDHGRGNITLSGSYMNQQGIQQKNRSWAYYPQTNDPTSAAGVNYGSIITPNGTFFGQDTGKTYLGTSNGSLVNYTKSGRYNYGPQQSLVNELQLSSLSGDTHYDVNSHLTLYANVLYSHKTSWAQMAGEPVEGSVPPSTLPNSVIIPEDYPGNNSGEALQVYRRMTEFGNRKTSTAMDTVTGMFGAKGDIYRGWKYDLSYTYGVSMDTIQQEGVGNYANLLREYGLEEDTPGDPNSLLYYNGNTCAGYTGCVQSNIFHPLSPSAANYANYTTHAHSQYQLRDLNLRIHNNHVVTMPWRGGGDLGFALGMEHRGEQLNYNPDPLVQSGGSLTNTVASTSGGYNVTEGYLEGELTLLKNVFLARDLTIDAQGRFSEYNTFGQAKNWKASIDWAPTRDIRFRATLGTSFRQPSVYEMYGGTTLSYNTANDPCAQADSYGSLSANVVANCAKQGINTATFQSAGAGQEPTLQGGNSKLKPEIGRTYTFGTVITPRWIPNLSTSITFWHYTVSGLIGSLATQYILDSCYTGTNNSLCSDINRLSNGQINTVSAQDQNLGGLITSGVDWDLNYMFRLTPHDMLLVDNNFQRLLKYKQQNVPGGQWYDYTGALFYQNGSANPIVRNYTTLTWRHNRFSVAYMFQYISGMNWNDGTNFLSKSGFGRVYTPSMVIQDLSFSYNLNRWAFRFNIDNLTDKDPPFVASASDNSAGGAYTAWYYGRTFSLQAGVNF
ncbi:TonB-dependent receptor domain-containing protein [Acidomonas methanolica]|uniref:TonB-dependent receptor domain-containing protein n=1 Tax=Acidomonas methanolica TaxID=437 RepID=UPI0009DD97BF|nr:TonB-dependent receptor [Acidomonas methanolica]TCS24069.1 TonB-dependent receptor-like protein [Acidomonas methanolica]